MKTLITILFLILSPIINAQDLVGGFVVYKSPLKEFTLIDQGKKDKTEPLVVGKTYTFPKESFEITTPTNSETIVYFSNDTLVRLYGNSDFRVDGFSQQVANTTGLPEKVKNSECMLNLALTSGEIEVISSVTDTNSLCVLQTPLVNLGLTKGIYVIHVEEKSVIVSIVEGSIKVYDNVTNKEQDVTSGKLIGIFPYGEMSARAKELFSDKTITAVVKEILPTNLKKLTESVNVLNGYYQYIIFAVIDNKMVGIKLK